MIQLRDDEYVLPGFFDVHAHYNMTLGVGGVRGDEYTYNPLIFLANRPGSDIASSPSSTRSRMAPRPNPVA